MTDDQIIARAKRIKVLLATDDVRDAFADIEAEFFAEFQTCRPEQVRQLRDAWDGYQRLRGKLQSWADELALRRIDG